MQTAEELRLRLMAQYAARPPAPLPARRASRPEGRAYAPEGGAIEGNGADDALLVDQGTVPGCLAKDSIINSSPDVSRIHQTSGLALSAVMYHGG